MRIGIYVQDLRASGVVRTMIGIARSLADAGDDVVVIAGTASGMFGAADVAPARLAIAAPTAPRLQPRLAIVPALRRTLRAVAPDVVLSGGNFGHFSLWAASAGLGIPVVYCFSNPMTRPGQGPRNRWRRIWAALLGRRAARMILVGGSLAADPALAPLVARGVAVTIPNGIDLTRAKAPSGPAPEAMQGPEPVVLSIGRLHPQKNFGALVDAVAVANRTRPVRLVILGTGAEAQREALLARAAARGIADRVLLAGTTPDVFPWLRAASVFALTSHWEGSSIALLEALAAGTPVAISRTAGDAPEVLDGGRYGLLADPDDAEAFAAALLRQIDDPVRPGSRAEDYGAHTMLARYREVLHAAAG